MSLRHARLKTKKKRESHIRMGPDHEGRISQVRFRFHAATPPGGWLSIAINLLSMSSSTTLMVTKATAIRIRATRMSPIKAKHEFNFDFGEVDKLGEIARPVILRL